MWARVDAPVSMDGDALPLPLDMIDGVRSANLKRTLPVLQSDQVRLVRAMSSLR